MGSGEKHGLFGNGEIVSKGVEYLRVFADLHIHSRFSRATSKKVSVKEIARFAKIKGLNLVGTGDFTHPRWMAELQEDLVEIRNTGLYEPPEIANSVNFMITGEVSTIFTFKGETKKVHHILLTQNFETATQVNDRLRKYGDLSLDGRPTLKMTGAQLVDEVMTVSPNNQVIPAHAWTPWFGLFGVFSGFDKIEDCYEDMTKHIYALETGLSSDPPMNWRLSALDSFTLVSNSDCHSCWPWRIGREANLFDLKHLKYDEIIDVLRKKDPQRLKLTIETNPAYGKYHWTGHRNCSISMPPQEAARFGTYCPVCRRKLTKGVEQRVEELADRPAGFVPQNAVGYSHLLPLSEIIATVLDASSPNLKSVWEIYNNLIAKFGNEYAVLMDAPVAQLSEASGPQIADAISKVRKGSVQFIPGYDGVYGKMILYENGQVEKEKIGKVPQRSLSEWH